ncbi:UDP-N-acetylmuramate dehydrogenase [soil metagenome]
MDFSDLKKDIPLSQLTTIKLGGPARYFYEFVSEEELINALLFAANNKLKIFILGGGSNVIFPDEGFNGLVLKNCIRFIESESNNNELIITAGSGVNWDELVKLNVDKGYSGIECLSGIPGSTGATPVQNVGAYGQEIKDTLVSVNTIERSNGEKKTFTNADCNFGYRSSRFKFQDKDKYVITSVTFNLKITEPEIKYMQLSDNLPEEFFNVNTGIEKKLSIIRKSVIQLRKSKSMVIDENDSDSVSCGSFFMNPVLNESEFNLFSLKAKDKHLIPPAFITGREYKIPAAWLIENSGFSKGYNYNGAAISSKHTLALVNKGCKTIDIIDLSRKIQESVLLKFGLNLLPEPVIL